MKVPPMSLPLLTLCFFVRVVLATESSSSKSSSSSSLLPSSTFSVSSKWQRPSSLSSISIDPASGSTIQNEAMDMMVSVSASSTSASQKSRRRRRRRSSFLRRSEPVDDDNDDTIEDSSTQDKTQTEDDNNENKNDETSSTLRFSFFDRRRFKDNQQPQQNDDDDKDDSKKEKGSISKKSSSIKRQKSSMDREERSQETTLDEDESNAADSAAVSEDKEKEEKTSAVKDEKSSKPQKARPFGFFNRRSNQSSSKEGEGEEDETKNQDEEKKEGRVEDSSPSSTEEHNEDEATDEDETKEDNHSKEGKTVAKKDDQSGDSSSSSTKLEPTLVPQRYSIIYRTAPVMSSPSRFITDGDGPSNNGIGKPTQVTPPMLLAGILANLVSLYSKWMLGLWFVSKFQADSELRVPRQHFMWECLNEKYAKDDIIWSSIKRRLPQSLGLSYRSKKWNKIVQGMGPTQEDKKAMKKEGSSPIPSRTVIVVDLDTVNNDTNELFENFAVMVSFLVGANGRYKKFFGSEPEVILNIQSPGGEVTSFALAAAQVQRLRNAGYKVTACVDRFAASGGYMVASQATQIVAAPFAVLGSVGVIMEGLNFYEALKAYGVKSLVIKAGEMKSPITSTGEVTEKDVKTQQKDLEVIHQSFIGFCRSNRPELDPNVCNGKVLSGDVALEKGMIDRILTFDEYIFEKITDGDIVMKLNLIRHVSEISNFLKVLQILPQIRMKLQQVLQVLFSGRPMAQLSEIPTSRMQVDGGVQNAVWGVVLATMIHRAIIQSSEFRKKGGKE